jgi:hypothetical protein
LSLWIPSPFLAHHTDYSTGAPYSDISGSLPLLRAWSSPIDLRVRGRGSAHDVDARLLPCESHRARGRPSMEATGAVVQIASQSCAELARHMAAANHGHAAATEISQIACRLPGLSPAHRHAFIACHTLLHLRATHHALDPFCARRPRGRGDLEGEWGIRRDGGQTRGAAALQFDFLRPTFQRVSSKTRSLTTTADSDTGFQGPAYIFRVCTTSVFVLRLFLNVL